MWVRYDLDGGFENGGTTWWAWSGPPVDPVPLSDEWEPVGHTSEPDTLDTSILPD